MKASVIAKLQASRKELLDIGLRNNLVSFKKTAKNLTITQADSKELFEALCVENKSLTFAPLEKSAQKPDPDHALEDLGSGDLELLSAIAGAGESIQVIERPDADKAKALRQSKVRLHTGLEDERLFLQLLKIRSEAQTYVEEQGVNVLFMAIGFLHWYESDSSSEVRRAPLVMAPVKLERTTARDLFKLEYTGDDLILNLSMAARLKTDFDIKLPIMDSEADQTSQDLAAYFDEVAESVKVHKRWSVQPNEVVLGFFSFGKFLMFKDLEPQSWPDDKSPGDHSVMGRLLGEGFGDIEPKYPEDLKIDTVCSPGDVHFVKDADSSQSQAILEVRAGSNLVIQGPPGTGKSQTITNLISELISQKKTVLFVAEKMAALDVVKRRLDESHLGDAVLELHSQRATKTSVLTELSRALDQGKPLNDTGEQDIESLKQVQQGLNEYCESVSAMIGNSGMPFLDVLGKYLQCKRQWPDLAPLNIASASLWKQSTFNQKRELVHELELHLEGMGRPDQSPFWGSTITFFDPIDENATSDALQQLLGYLAEIDGGTLALSQRLMLSRPASLLDIDVVCRAARRAEQAPKLQGVHISTQDWQLRRDALRTLVGAGRSMTDLRLKFDKQLIDLAWEQDLLPVRRDLLAYGSKWWRFLSSEYKGAKQALQALTREVLPREPVDMLKIVDAVLDYQQSQKEYAQVESLGEALFGAQWQGKKSDWDVLDRITEWVVNLHDDLGNGTIPAGIIDFLSGNSDPSGLVSMVEQIEGSIVKMKATLERVSTSLGMDQENGGSDLHQSPFEELSGKFTLWQTNLPKLHAMARYSALGKKLSDDLLVEFVKLAESCEQPAHLTACFDLTWYSGLVQLAYAKSPSLQQFDRIQHEHKISRFRALDLASLRHAQTKLAAQVWAAKPNINQPGEIAILRAELNKKRKHLPIRQLIAKAGRAIQQIKPVFMMSPMSIANFLPPGNIEFDVVIFDEASQVKAVDAFGAILRGKQIVVVGDTRQMPPTDFFGREVEIDDEDNTTGDIESILSMFKAAGCSERYLKWHYRSRHESLIAVSNAEFYDNKLVIFPSSGSNLNATGVSFEHLPETFYDRGRTRTNKGEAKAVAEAVIQHAILRPDMSLGVAAFSVAQRDLIEIELELLRRRKPEAEAFFSAHPTEPFFVKNLENIQGDERDAIFISIGYGRNETGKIAKEFGPLNKDGGHRRLNVLITRSKMAMKVFCNFRADELDLDASAKHGVRALKNFLKYAETGQLEVAQETGKAPDSPFESEVIQALRDLNYEIEPQVGTAGYFIDMAVRDPDYPGRYLLAIECDGAAYHSSRSARDRDRLRQGVLEGLGWTFHRIWSTDWFRNRKEELSRVVAAIAAAKLQLGVALLPVSIESPAVVHVIERGAPEADVPTQFASPYVKAQLASVTGIALHEASTPDLGDLIAKVVMAEAPVHMSEVVRRLMDAYGVTRAGSRITARVQEVTEHFSMQRMLRFNSEFLYATDGLAIRVRNRSELSPADRKIEWVAPEEIDEALLQSVRLGFSLSMDDAVSSALNLLGFGRATQRISSAVEDRLALLLEKNRVSFANGMVTPAPDAVRT